MIENLLNQLKNLTAQGGTLYVGEVISTFTNGTVKVKLLQGGSMIARGEMQVGQHVYVQDGAVISEAPDLPFAELEI